MRKKTGALILALSLALGLWVPAASAPEPGYANLRRTDTYADGMFSDVPADSGDRDEIAAVYELGLMHGNGERFGAEDAMTLAETLSVACRLHSLYRTGAAEFVSDGAWYQSYVDYAAEHGLFSQEGADYGSAVTRSQFVGVLARALPSSALPSINEAPYGKLADVSALSANAEEIYLLYRAGVLSLNEGRARFVPNAPITHAESAGIAARMAYRSLRLKYALPEWPWPDLREQPRAEDDDLSGSAMLGASLVQGMSLYSGLRDAMDFYCDAGTGINGAEYWVDALCRYSYERVYIEYGADDLYMAPEDFAAAMKALVQRVRGAMPDAEIYVMALTPVTKERSESGEFPMRTILSFNEALYGMCESEKIWYLDVCAPLCNAEGYLPADYAGWDGSPHLSEAGYSAWEEIIRTRYSNS